MNIREVRKVVSKIKGSLFKRSNSYAIGMLKSNFRGTGLQFKEHRVYTHGDDVRFIDWKILAKMDQPYIKTFEEERNVEIVVVIDVAETMLTGFNNVSKLQASIEICCLLYLLAKETSDYVRAIILTDKIIDLPKKSGEAGITQLVKTLEKNNILLENGKINLNLSFEQRDKEKLFLKLMKSLRRKKEIVILSDFQDFLETDLLKKLVYQKNVHGFRITGPLDRFEKSPFIIFSKKENKKGLFETKVKKEELDELMGKRIKDIEVENSYLDSFIREMI